MCCHGNNSSLNHLTEVVSVRFKKEGSGVLRSAYIYGLIDRSLLVGNLLYTTLSYCTLVGQLDAEFTYAVRSLKSLLESTMTNKILFALFFSVVCLLSSRNT